jgi:hypothetical protein
MWSGGVAVLEFPGMVHHVVGGGADEEGERPGSGRLAVDAGLKADAFAEGRWVHDHLTASLADFKAEIDTGRAPLPPDTDVRRQTLAAIGERTVAASTAITRLEATAATEIARGLVVATGDAVDGTRRAFDNYVAARTASISGTAPADLGAAAGQLDIARRVLLAALDQLRTF